MEHYTNFFELHLGFPIQAGSGQTVGAISRRLQANSADWQRSEVRSVHLTEPGCLDPHNVPGTLGWLVSRKIYRSDQSWSSTIESAVLPACNCALEELAKAGVHDARLEIEFPFGCLAAATVNSKVTRSAWADDPVTIDSIRLRFPNGVMLNNVPQWEIHFLLEQIPGSQAPLLTVTDVPAFLARYGLVIEQTIEYKSQAMIDAGRTDFRLIATSYGTGLDHEQHFKDSVATKREAERVFYESSLCEDAASQGYNVRLILEHIIACVRPSAVENNLHNTNSVEVNCAP